MPQLRKLVTFLFLLVSIPIWALPVNAHWNVRIDGSNTNGGIFDSTVTSPGTDYSNQASYQIAYTDIVIGGTTSTFTSAANPATSAYPGNGIYISGGTGCTVGWYEIASQSSGTYTMDRSLGTAASTCTGYLGGAVQTISTATNNMSSGETIYLKAGTYTLTSAVSITNTTTIIGYNTTYNDMGTKPLITTSTNSTNLFSVGSNSTLTVINVSFSNTASTKAAGIIGSSIANMLALNYVYATGFGGSANGGPFVDGSNGGSANQWNNVFITNSEFTGNTSALNFAGSSCKNVFIIHNYFHGNTEDIYEMLQGILYGNIFSGASGTYSVKLDGNADVWNNTFYGATGYALYFPGTNTVGCVGNNIFYSNGTGIQTSTISQGFPACSGANAFGANTTNTAGSIPLPTTTTDITLTANPFVNSGSANFALNSTAGGGALLAGKGLPLAFGSATTNGLNVGAVQSSSGGGGGTTVAPQGYSY